MDMNQVTNGVSVYSDKALQLLIEYGPNVLLALLTLLIGLWIIKLLSKGFGRTLQKAKVEASLEKFLLSLVGIILKVLLVISVVSMLGVQMTSFIAILGAAGLAVGLALQGSLANFAGGVLLLLFKPFKVGDFIDGQGFTGTVNAIQVFNTVLKTPDNKTVIIPNGNLSNGAITNFTAEKNRRVDWTFGIGYSDDLKKAKEILAQLVKSDPRILNEPESLVALSELGDSSVNFVVRAWVKREDFWGVYFDMQEKVKLTFDEQGISIPFPQRDVHVYNHKPGI
jgi:small conductance mechanosensitive channel